MGTIKISIGIISMGQVHLETMRDTIYALNNLTEPYAYRLNFHKGTYVQALRNDCVKEALEQEADYLMFIDTDMVFPPDGITRLLERKKDVIGGMYHMKGLPLVNTIKVLGKDGKQAKVKDVEVPNKLFKVFAVPTGFMLIKLSAIKDMKNLFDFDRDENGDLIGEDINFCKRLIEKGVEIWCDPTIAIGHIGEYLY
jgi:GT2 family glycosyltransferase